MMINSSIFFRILPLSLKLFDLTLRSPPISLLGPQVTKIFFK